MLQKNNFIDDALEIEAIAQNTLSNFGGHQGNPFVEFDGPDDDEDDDVSFIGNVRNFETENKANLFFKFRVKNVSTTDEEFLLSPGLNYAPMAPLATGVIRTGLFASLDGTANAFEATSSGGKTIEQFLAWIDNVPTRIPKAKIVHSSTAQAGELWEIASENPFLDNGYRPLEIDHSTDGDTYNDKITVIRGGLQLSKQSRIKVRVLAGESMNVTLYAGAMLNIAAKLERKAVRRAKNTLIKANAIAEHKMRRALGIAE